MRGRYEDRKLSLPARILITYGVLVILGLSYLGIISGWTYFHSGNILLLAFIIASYPILGIALTILEVIFGKDGGF